MQTKSSSYRGKVQRAACLLLSAAILPWACQASEIEAVLRKFVDDKVISGAVTFMANDRSTQINAVGLADIENKTPMEPDALFWIASMTKPIAGAAILLLVDQGKLSVNDPVEKHLPEFRRQWMIASQSREEKKLAPAPRPITVLDLLTHTSGLADVPAPRPNATLAELTMAYAQQPLLFPPGSKWSYSNSGINTLGRIVEVLSGVPFAEFIQTKFFVPLGMDDTTFWPNEQQASRLAKSYRPSQGGNQLEAADIFFLRGGLSDRNRTSYPAGGLFSTASDMGRFYRMMLNKGVYAGKRILSENAVAELTRTQTAEDITTGFVNGMSWGLGFQVVKEPKGVNEMLSAGTFGHGGAYGTQSWADPQRGWIMILMIQRAGLPNADDSEVRKAFQAAAAEAFQKQDSK